MFGAEDDVYGPEAKGKGKRDVSAAVVSALLCYMSPAGFDVSAPVIGGFFSLFGERTMM